MVENINDFNKKLNTALSAYNSLVEKKDGVSEQNVSSIIKQYGKKLFEELLNSGIKLSDINKDYLDRYVNIYGYEFEYVDMEDGKRRLKTEEELQQEDIKNRTRTSDMDLLLGQYENRLKDEENIQQNAVEEKDEKDVPADVLEKDDNLNDVEEKNLGANQNVDEEYVNAVQEKDPETLRKNLEKYRKRSPYSDLNQYLMDMISADVYHDMGIISDEDWTKTRQNQKSCFDVISKVPNLEGDRAKDFSYRFAKRLLNSDLFDLIPPSALAKAYTKVKELIDDAKKQNKDISELKGMFEKLKNRIDDLSNQFDYNVGYYFADVTNIQDVYDGYKEMFEVRKADLDAEKDAALISELSRNQDKLDTFIAEYDERWALKDLDEKSVNKLNSRYEEIVQLLKNVELSNETLKLCSKYKFKDENDNVIPQFIDKKGKLVVDFSDGCKLDPNSRLARIISLAKGDVTREHIGNLNEKIQDVDWNKEVNDKVPFKLFEIDNVEKTILGVLEEPDKFTNPEHYNNFLNTLSREGGEISDCGYQSALDAQVNSVGGYAGRMASKIGNDKSILSKQFKEVEDIDKLAESRTEVIGADKRKTRKNLIIRAVKGFASAGLVSAGITTVATMADAAGVVDGRGLAAMGIGVALGIACTARSIHKWKKAMKEEGKPHNLKAFLKDKRNLSMIATTSLATGALGFAAVGMPGVASALGISAMGIGAINNGVTAYKDANTAKLSKLESVAYAILNAGAVIGGGFAGRAAATSAISSFNAHHPDNTIFQHKEVNQSVETRIECETVYKDGVSEDAHRVLNQWYRGDEGQDLLQQRVDAINAYNDAHGTNIDPYRYLLASHDAGALTPDNNLLHNQFGPDVHSHGNHMVLGQGWSNEYGVSQNLVHTLANSIGADGSLNITPESVSAFNAIDPHIGMGNVVGHVNSAVSFDDHVLHDNAVMGSDGRLHQVSNGDVYSTYADHNGVFTTVEHVVETPVEVETLTPAHGSGLGVFGFFQKRPTILTKIKNRVGSLLDKIKTKEGNSSDKNSGLKDFQPKPVKPMEKLNPKARGNELSPAGKEGIALIDKGLENLRQKSDEKGLQPKPEQHQLPEHMKSGEDRFVKGEERLRNKKDMGIHSKYREAVKRLKEIEERNKELEERLKRLEKMMRHFEDDGK